MAEIDEILWQETKENLMADGLDQDSAEIILYDMKETGFFDIEDEDEDEDDDDYDFERDRICSYPCATCGEGDDDDQ